MVFFELNRCTWIYTIKMEIKFDETLENAKKKNSPTKVSKLSTDNLMGYLHMLCERRLVPKLNVENVDVKIPNGNAPIPSDIWKPPSPNPNPWNVALGSGSVRWPAGRGGTFELKRDANAYKQTWIWFFDAVQKRCAYRGSSSLVLPRPYSGTTFSLLIAALHTGQSWRVGRVSSHWCKHGQQNKWPHILTTASLAVSKQMLHSNIESSFFDPLPLLLLDSAFCLVASLSVCMDFIISFAAE